MQCVYQRVGYLLFMFWQKINIYVYIWYKRYRVYVPFALQGWGVALLVTICMIEKCKEIEYECNLYMKFIWHFCFLVSPPPFIYIYIYIYIYADNADT